MTIEEIMKKNGMTDEQVTAAMADMKESKIYTAGEENLDIRYNQLKAKHDNTNTQLTEAQKLIETLKSENAGNAGLQEKVSSYESTIGALNEQLKNERINNAIQLALRDAGAKDTDYLAFKLREKGEIELDDKGNIKGINDKIAALKTQLPTQFAAGEGSRQIIEHQLDGGTGDNKHMTKADFLKKPYSERAAFMEENPDAYHEMMNG